MKNKEVLKELGLTEGEIKVYFSLFELGEITVGPISKKSKVTHAKVYPILEKLIKKGLVTHIIKDGRKNFSAAHPDSLLEFVEKKVRQLEQEKDKIKEIIPSLLAKQKEVEQVQYSRVFEGFKGLRSLFYELFNNKNKEKIWVFGLNDLMDDPSFISFFRFYHDLRIKNKIKLKLILNKNKKEVWKKNLQSSNMYTKGDQIKFVNIIFPTGVFMYKDHVIHIVADNKITAFDIKSKQNSERYKEFFNSIWRKS